MKTLFGKITDMLAATALSEIEGNEAVRELLEHHDTRDFSGTTALERELSAAAYAEAADFETARQILHERDHPQLEREVIVPDDCRYADNDLCSVQA